MVNNNNRLNLIAIITILKTKALSKPIPIVHVIIEGTENADKIKGGNGNDRITGNNGDEYSQWWTGG